MALYERSAYLYDALYNFKDYATEVYTLKDLMQHLSRRPVKSVLDVACGTGGHLAFLQNDYACTGVDVSAGQIEVARGKLPGVSLHVGDMRDFNLDTTFDAVVCLFSSIGYMPDAASLEQAVANLGRHVAPGGLLVIEPWFRSGEFFDGHISARFVDQPALKIARFSISRIEGRLSIMDMHHLVATPEGIEHFTELHEMFLFTHQEYLGALTAAGLEPVYDEHGLTGRGLYVGVKPD